MTPRTRQKLSASATRFKAAADFRLACAVVGRAHGLDPNAIRQPIADVHRIGLAARGIAGHDRVRQVVRARHEAIYLAVTVCGARLRAVADAAGIRAPTVHAIVRGVEDGREDPTYDRHLDELELECLA
jgi:chromosomal replication initiation ATPase DnaA